MRGVGGRVGLFAIPSVHRFNWFHLFKFVSPW